MTLLEKTKASADTTRLTLYKEGIFYKCYNEDAMVFVKMVRDYKITSRFVKSIGSEVLSIGFPVSEVENGNLSTAKIEKQIGAVKLEEFDKRLIFYLGENLKEDYHYWAEHLLQEQKPLFNEMHELEKDLDVAQLITMIRDFDLANSTPMQGLIFIQKMKALVQKPD